jgi:NAD(P)H dehydrogenase (quinone)
VLYANPVRASFGSALHQQVVSVLTAKGHAVDDCDLYLEAFDPILREDERIAYHDTNRNRRGVSSYADRVLAAEALILIYPVWNEGFPAILKGFLDRVFIPGVSFKIGAEGRVEPNLPNLKRLSAVCTYGASRTITFLLGDPPKRVVKRLIRSMAKRSVRCDYLACYGMDQATDGNRKSFLDKVGRVFAAW